MPGFPAKWSWLLLLVPLPAPSQSPGTDDMLGIWASESVYRPGLLGELVVRRAATGWVATLGGAEVRAELKGDSVRLGFGSEVGRFRGRLAAGGRSITGFWLQPPAVSAERPTPVGYGQRFATPLVLARVRPGEWRGTVRQLEQRFTLFLKVYRDSADRLLGAIRNHERNSNGGATLYRLTRQGDSVVLTAPLDGPAQVRHAAVFAGAGEGFRLFWPDAREVLRLGPATPTQASNFSRRPPGAPPYSYRAPPPTGDGWETDRAREVGFDEDSLTGVIRRIAAADPAVRAPPLMHSLLVARRGKLVLEEYFFGFTRDTPHDTRSAGKTFAAVLLGAAMRRGARLSPESRVYQVMAPLGPFANPDPRKARITLAHLLTHTPGLACDDNDEASPGNENTLTSQRGQPDWWTYTLDLPMAHEPGVRYAYCSANINLVGGALTVGTGTWVPELFERWIARPLEFGPYHWNLTPNDQGYFGGGSYLRPRDLLKVGQASLDGGVWRGRRIVDSSWIAESTKSRIHISPASTGLSPEAFGEFYGGGNDGYAWHLGAVESGDRVYRTYAAIGNGGQVLLVVPELRLVVVFTGANYGQGGIWGRWSQQIVGSQIIPALGPQPEPPRS
ncbi:MAG TPA: serine hydrolase [Gemmatimonadales bacterium]|nr:serine hydrolase [Gemmatimonadales bacterium]